MSKEGFLPQKNEQGRKIIFESEKPPKDQLEAKPESTSSGDEKRIAETKEREAKEKRTESDHTRIGEIRKELGLDSQTKEDRVSVSASLQRVNETLKVKEDLAFERKLELQKPKEKPTPDDIAIGFWEDRSKKTSEDIKLYEGLLLKDKEEFNKTYGELAEHLWSQLPTLVANKKKELEEYEAVAKSLREKKDMEDSKAVE